MSDLIQHPSLYAPPGFKNYSVFNQSEDEYHADKSAVGSTGTRLILDSAKAFQWSHFRGYQIEQTRDIKLGKIIHTATVEGSKFKEKYVVMPEFWGLTKKGDRTNSGACTEVKEKCAAWLADQPPGAIIVTKEQRDMMIGIVEGILEHPQGPSLFSNGKPEVSGYYVDQVTGIKCKFRTDYLSNNCLSLVDLKSARTSKRELFGSDAHARGYPIQMAQYKVGVKEVFGVAPEVISIVAVEKVWPFECAIYYLEADDLAPGLADYRRGLDRLHACLQSGKWPQRQAKIERLHTPTWKMAQLINEEEENDVA